MSKTTKCVLWALPIDCGDGSATVRYFTTREKADYYQSFEEQPFAEGASPKTFEIRDGQIVGPDLDPTHHKDDS